MLAMGERSIASKGRACERNNCPRSWQSANGSPMYKDLMAAAQWLWGWKMVIVMEQDWVVVVIVLYFRCGVTRPDNDVIPTEDGCRSTGEPVSRDCFAMNVQRPL
ncbi:unnamed protein product [Ostreobium quekettii]|uniref:Uncharacterized protein n=1 Tax=Ostreobium quekettii TaxID=121088 RepID=A0A8S1ITD7_9CHLO|nr:unnamed protein product [Ostreobium quekettii]